MFKLIVKYNLYGNDVDIVVLDNPILNTNNKSDLEKTLIFELLSYMSEKERLKAKQRRMEGINVLRARNNGKWIGRHVTKCPSNFEEVYNKWKHKEIKAVDAMAELGLKKNTFCKLVKEYNNEV